MPSRRRCASEGTVGVIVADAAVPRPPTAARAAPASRYDLLGEEAQAFDTRVDLVPATLAKGLEFDHVVLLEPADIVAGEPDQVTGLRRLYVCLTRAVTSLVVVHASRCRPRSPIDPTSTCINGVGVASCSSSGGNGMPSSVVPAALNEIYRLIKPHLPSRERSGIINDGNNSGYHPSRNVLIAKGRSGDYSLQAPADLRGDGDLASAIDIKFNDAEMKLVSSRLRAACTPDAAGDRRPADRVHPRVHRHHQRPRCLRLQPVQDRPARSAGIPTATPMRRICGMCTSRSSATGRATRWP